MKDESRQFDFFAVPEHQHSIHQKLEDWSRWVSVRIPRWVHPMFKQYRSHAWQWHTPEIRPTVNLIEAAQMEKHVCRLPEPHRGVIRWAYVYRYGALKARREFALTEAGLNRCLVDGRQMLINRGLT